MPLLAALVLVTGAMTGCIGLGSQDEEASPTSADAGNTTDPGSGATSGANASAATIEARTLATFDGSGTGIGFSPTMSNFWITGEGIRYDLNVPDRFEGGTVTLNWTSTYSRGGMWVWILDSDDEPIHAFIAESSPYEAQLDPDDDRLEGAASALILPDQGLPATAHAQAEWSGQLTLQVPT